MSSYAQEWVWRYSKAKGIAKYVFLALARRILKRDAVTLPTTIEELVEVTGLAEKTIRRSIEALEQQDEIKVLRGQRRGAIHRYQLCRELRLPLVDAEPSSPVTETSETDDLSAVAETTDSEFSPVGETSETDGSSPVIETTDNEFSPVRETSDRHDDSMVVTGQRDQCHRSERPVSPVGETSGLVRTSSSNVRTKEDLKEDLNKRTTAAAPRPRFISQAQKPSDNGNYCVIAKLAYDLCRQGYWVHQDTRFDITSESELTQALKDECRRLDIVRDEFDVVHRAAASEWFKYCHPEIARRVVMG